MPIYEYACEDCGVIFDKLVAVTDDNNIECPLCESKKTQKLVSVVSACGDGDNDYGSSCTNFS